MVGIETACGKFIIGGDLCRPAYGHMSPGPSYGGSFTFIGTTTSPGLTVFRAFALYYELRYVGCWLLV